MTFENTKGWNSVFNRNGFAAGFHAFSESEAMQLRGRVEQLEQDHAAGAGGYDLNQFFRVNGHLVIPLLAEIAKTERILDIVETLLGPDLMVWSVELFIKEAKSAHTVSWHQDLTYWGMGETDDEVTAWVALSDVSIEAGCMRFMPGSHLGALVEHQDTFSESNLLSRGQEIPGVDDSQAIYGPLQPGEMSLHHGRCYHSSGQNQSDDRRIGVAIRYVTPGVRDSLHNKDYAMLVRGSDRQQGWINVAGARSLFHENDLALYSEVLREQSAVLAAGAATKTALYSLAQS
ncbi:MAG: phytanoyl-CoA dioxygenase family protein [Pseudomonadales bacterium]